MEFTELSLQKENMIFIKKVAQFIQVPEKMRQLCRQGNESRVLGFGIFRPQANQSSFHAHSVPRQTQKLSRPHAGLLRHEVNGLKMWH